VRGTHAGPHPHPSQRRAPCCRWDAINAQLEAALLKVGALQPEQLEPLAPPVKANLILL